MTFSLTQNFLRGCGWFSLIFGGAIGVVFSLVSVHESGVLAPSVGRGLFTHLLLGRLPTLLVAAFVLLRINFQLATDVGLARRLFEGRKTAAYAGACILACLVAWIWFFLSVLGGSWLGMMLGLSGDGHGVWESYWIDFQYADFIHAAIRMILLAFCLSLLAFIEIHVLQSHQDSAHLMMSRAMTLGMLLIIAIEVADLFWMLQ